MSVSYYKGDTVQFEKTVVALGTFDGLHTAHMKIINRAKEYAVENGYKWGVMFFDIIPANAFSENKVKSIMTNSEKKQILNNADFFYTECFDEAFFGKTTEEFADYLKDVLHACAVSVGYNYRFGKNASGDTDELIRVCEKRDIKVFVCEKNEMGGDAVSSTRIRKLISEGIVKSASELLGRVYSISGTVEAGFHNGTLMGFPTANISIDDSLLLPKSGVYAGYCSVDGKKYKSVINIGDNPTFDGKKVTVECHILDFCEQIYGNKVKAELVKRIRDEIKFESVEMLVEQIKRDVEFSRRELD